MVKPSGRIEKELGLLQQQTEAMAEALEPLYEGYLKALGGAAQRQLVTAAYYLCTKAYPDKFLQLSWQQRNNLQRSLQALAHEIHSQLTMQREQAKKASRRPHQPHGMAFLQRLLEAKASGATMITTDGSRDDLEAKLAALKRAAGRQTPKDSPDKDSSDRDRSDPENSEKENSDRESDSSSRRVLDQYRRSAAETELAAEAHESASRNPEADESKSRDAEGLNLRHDVGRDLERDAELDSGVSSKRDSAEVLGPNNESTEALSIDGGTDRISDELRSDDLKADLLPELSELEAGGNALGEGVLSAGAEAKSARLDDDLLDDGLEDDGLGDDGLTHNDDELDFGADVPAAEQRLTLTDEEDLLMALEGLARRSVRLESEEENDTEQPLAPIHLVKQQVLFEQAVREVFKAVSEEANELLQKAEVMPSFPKALMAAAADSRGLGEPVNSVPNVIKVSIRVMHGEALFESDESEARPKPRRSRQRKSQRRSPSPSKRPKSEFLEPSESGDEADMSSVRKLMSREAVEFDTLPEFAAMSLQLSEIEFSDPAVSAWRRRLRQKLSELKQLGMRYQKSQRALETARAEDAWRSSWTILQDD